MPGTREGQLCQGMGGFPASPGLGPRLAWCHEHRWVDDVDGRAMEKTRNALGTRVNVPKPFLPL